LFFTKKAGVQKTITTKTSIVIGRRNIDIKILSNLPDLIIDFKLYFFNGIQVHQQIQPDETIKEVTENSKGKATTCVHTSTQGQNIQNNMPALCN